MNIQYITASQSSINIIETYICPESTANLGSDPVLVGWDRDIPFTINHSTTPTFQTVKEYHHRDMTYIYDLENDGQRVVRRLAQKEDTAGGNNVYTVAYTEEVLPTHRFPSTRDIAHSEITKRKSYRINNRLHFIHDEDEDGRLHYYYFRYQHADNVDVRKMQHDFDRTFRCIQMQFR